MKLATGRWVSGSDFFNRNSELRSLERLVGDGNHVLLTGQRRMGKTSVVRELGRRLHEDRGERDRWTVVFTDVEGATCEEAVVEEIARAVHPIRSIARRFAATARHVFTENVEQINALEFGLKLRAGLNAGTWRRHGEQLINDIAAQPEPTLLVMDELPIFLKRMSRNDDGVQRVDVFLSWLRGVLQRLGGDGPVLVVSGSIGLEPLVRGLGIPDRINHLYPYRLGPWDRKTSVECFARLADEYELSIEEGVADAVYDALGVGIPHYVQSMFAHLSEVATSPDSKRRLTVADVGTVYDTKLLGPLGQSDLIHYETRLADALDEASHRIAMLILAECAIAGMFTSDARLLLERQHAMMLPDAPALVVDVLEVLVHDGYLEVNPDGYRFSSNILKDWWSLRYRDRYEPLTKRSSGGQ